MEPEAKIEPIDSFSSLKKRTVKGVAALTSKTFLLQIISFFGFFFLSVLLNKEEIGLFFAISELVAILGYFSDIGLAAALIQKKKKPTLSDIRSTFTIQEGIVFLLVTLVVIFTPVIGRFYRVSQAGIWLLRALTFGFFLASLKTIPSVLLERKLRFDLLVVVEIVENLIFYSISVLLAWKGFGVLSYAWAVALRGVVGLVIIYSFSPWRIGLDFRKKSLSRLLRFGVPYQANSILAVVKDRLMNVFLWRIIGASGVGILGWAQKWAQMPLRFVMDPVLRVTFPAFSRIQEKKERLREAVEFSLFVVAAISWPLLVGLAILARPLIMMIPSYQKWLVALVPLYLFCFNSAWGAITTPLTNAFNAVGKIKVTFKLMIFWTILTWVLTPILAIKFGFLGAAWALGLVPVSSLLVFYLVLKDFEIHVFSSVLAPFIAGFLMAGFLKLFLVFMGQVNLALLIFLILAAGGIYSFFLYLLAKEKLTKAISLFKNAFS